MPFYKQMKDGKLCDPANFGLGFTHPAIVADPGEKVDTASGQ